MGRIYTGQAMCSFNLKKVHQKWPRNRERMIFSILRRLSWNTVNNYRGDTNLRSFLFWGVTSNVHVCVRVVARGVSDSAWRENSNLHPFGNWMLQLLVGQNVRSVFPLHRTAQNLCSSRSLHSLQGLWGREGEHTAQKQAGRADSPSLVTKRVREPHKVIFKQVNYKWILCRIPEPWPTEYPHGTETTHRVTDFCLCRCWT